MDEVLDLEDIESRLYSQVYHVSAEPAEETDLSYSEYTADFRKKFRYFDKKIDNSTAGPLGTETSISHIENKPVEETNTNNFNSESSTAWTPIIDNTYFSSNISDIPNSNISGLVQNDSGLLPLITNPNDPCFESYYLPAYLQLIPTASNPNLIREIENVRVRKKRIRKRRTKNNKDLQNNFINKVSGKRNHLPPLNTSTIFLSDSDSNECIIIDNMNTSKEQLINTKFPKKYNEKEGGTPPEPDDDIIFVPPPPVEVISVDNDDGEKSSHLEKPIPKEKDPNKKMSNVETAESTLSNDFLENSNLEHNTSNFNFSLHGSDFNNSQTDVVSQQKPAEYCETESSCSTNDQHSRDFSNTVKTIVFDEVEFPREDIFCDKSLESFSSFITPKRSCSLKPKESLVKSKKHSANDEIDLSSDTSSSESDYESNYKKKVDHLPNLSPMMPNDIPNKRLKKTAQEFFKSTNKNSITEEKEDSNSMKAPQPVKNSKKQKDSEKANRRKKKSIDNVDENISFDQTEENCSSTPNNSKSKKNKKKDHSVPEEMVESNNQDVDESLDKTTETTIEDICEKTKKKKKKRDSITEKCANTEQEIINKQLTEVIDGLINEEKATDEIKKKKKADGLTDISAEQENVDQPSINLDDSEKSKRKKKKRNSETSEKLQEETNESNSNQEAAINNFIKDVEVTIDLSRNFGQKKKKKKKKDEEVDVITKKTQPDEEPSMSKKKKKQKENIAQKDDIDISQDKSDSNLTEEVIVLDENESENPEKYVVIDSTDSSDVELVTDSESDFQVLDDVGQDLFLNCSSSMNNINKIDISQEDIDRTLGHARLPLLNPEQFSVEQIQSQQSNDPSKWQVSYKDRALNLYQNRGPRCTRCKHYGHISLRCPNRFNPIPCTLCGDPYHQEPRCPNKRCTQCGNPGAYSTTYCSQCFKFRHSQCDLCHMPGHIQKFCPDLWRRYHVTSDGPIVILPDSPFPRNLQWCSGCATRGHLEHECDYYNRQFPPTSPFIMNYTDVLKENKLNKHNHIDELVNPANINPQMLPPQTINKMLNFVPPEISVPNLPSQVDMVMSQPSTSNLTIQVGNNPVPNDIVLQMMVNFNNGTNNPNVIHTNQHNQFRYPQKQNEPINLNNMQEVEHFIMSEQDQNVYDFLNRQMHYMQKSNIDPKLLQKKFFKFNKILSRNTDLPESICNEKDFWYRLLNMFVFGIHKHKDGRLHVNHLKSYLSQGRNVNLQLYRRRSLFSSYSYIFGTNQRENVDYYKIIRLLVKKNSRN